MANMERYRNLLFYPEKYVTGVESSYNLEGFVWREDRPVLLPMPEESSARDTP